MRLKDKTSVVTGSGAGIGRAVARTFAQEGATVVVADINAQEAEETARLITEAGGTALAVQTDVADPRGRPSQLCGIPAVSKLDLRATIFPRLEPSPSLCRDARA